ncbi:MAG: glutamate-5-semialdehyde dehydrogenase, partial [Pseudomonadota bacterium]
MTETSLDPRIHIAQLGANAKQAAKRLRSATTQQKNTALIEAAKALRMATEDLVTANTKDVDSVRDTKPASFIDRLMLDADRIAAMASALEDIAKLPDPVGRKLATFERPNGLNIERVAVPIGVIGMIYESRPNVGSDASALCLKSGNAVILRGGSESRHSTRVIVECMQKGLEAAGLPPAAVQTVQTTSREAVAEILGAVDHIDLVIPRGGRGLNELVRDNAKVPTLLHLDGNCHIYVHAEADLEKAVP